ncbi:MAG: indole-3-glycerol phosphate synthase TrpC [Archaeoglobus sp.]|nr:indole-3-glycerol phosphate synthase TrpC [Archaeoglobus sp.]
MMDFGLSDAIKVCKDQQMNPVIAEIKFYSPKHGDLLGKRDPLRLLEAYERGGAAGISYVTARQFGGEFSLLRKICKETNLPVLRKDFILDKSEIESTAEADASAILLITRFLKDSTAEFVDYALEHGLETLVEVHNLNEIGIANETKTTMVGINNRDIAKLELDDVSVEVAERLYRFVKNDVVKVSESGIRGLEELNRALKVADAVLIGTASMLAENIEEKIREFVGGGEFGD